MEANRVAVKVENLSRRFGSVEALKGVSFEIPTGTVFGLLGPNGSGKTTTIRLLLGLLEPDSGQVEVLGMDPLRQGDAVRESCGALLEHTGLYERLTALDNLVFFGRVWRLPKAERDARIEELLNSIGLWERRKEVVGGWSRGMKQKLAVARALLHRPRLVFLDEPTAGLDPVAAAALREDLLRLAEQSGVTVFLTTHNLTEAEKLCNQVGVLREGRLLAVGAPEELRGRSGSQRVEIYGRKLTGETMLAQLNALPDVVEARQVNQHLTIDLKQDADSAELVRFLVTRGADVDEVRKTGTSLEEVFLALMEEQK